MARENPSCSGEDVSDDTIGAEERAACSTRVPQTTRTYRGDDASADQKIARFDYPNLLSHLLLHLFHTAHLV
jgi:hypothetical protein